MSDKDSVLTGIGLTKEFPGVVALDDVDFDLRHGEVHVLLGENGAGKSTLIKILSGVYKCDKGKILIEGKEVTISNTLQAMQMGIATCYQEFNLVPYLSIYENIYLGNFEKIHEGVPLIRKSKMIAESQKILDSMGINLDVRKNICELGVAQKQMVEIARSLQKDAKIYILDEPTAVLSQTEIDELFRVIKKLKELGRSIVYISHRLEELPIIGDRVTVLRDGKKIDTKDIKNTTVDQLIEMMVGRRLEDTFPKISLNIGKELLRVEGLNKENMFYDINLHVNAGEIVGLAGLVGSKRTEVARAVFGADKITSGKIFVNGQKLTKRSPRKAVNNGLCYLPEERKLAGLVLGMSVNDNISLPSIKKNTNICIIKDASLRASSKKYINKLGIKTPSIKQLVKNLSGGNQQKIVIAKWMASGCNMFIFDEPTRGIDVKAKAEVYTLMNELIKAGAGILMISSEMPEIINMCDRVYVMNNGRIRAELEKDITQETVLKYALATDKCVS